MPDPATRSHTALFVLAGRILNARHLPEKDANYCDRDFPVNRPGQNAAECYVLAILAFILTTGFFTVTTGDLLGSHFWSFALALPLGVLLTFIALHLQFFGFAFIYHCLRSIYLVPRSAPKKVPVPVYLCFFTLFAAVIAYSGKLSLIIVAAPWLTWASINFFAWMILLVTGFISLLRGKPR